MNQAQVTFVRAIRREWLLCAIIIVSTLLAWHRVDDCRLWVDEFFSIAIAQRPLGDIWSMAPHAVGFNFNSSPPQYPEGYYFNTFAPLYETILHFVWDAYAPKQVLVARAVSVLLHVVSLGLLFYIGRLLFDRGSAACAVFLAGINYAYLYYAKMIRGYTLFNVLTMCSFLLFVLILRQGRPRKKFLAALAAVNTLLLYMSYFSALLILFQGLIFLFRAPRRVLSYWKWLLLSFVFFLPWMPHLARDVFMEPAVTRSGAAQALDLSAAINIMHTVWQRFSARFFFNSWLAGAYAVMLLWCFPRAEKYPDQRQSRQDDRELLWGVLGIVVLINYLTGRVGDLDRVRYSFAFAFPIFLITGCVIRNLRRPWGAGLLILFTAFSLIALHQWFGLPAHEFWRSDLAWVAQEARQFPVRENERVVIEIEHFPLTPAFVYYFMGPQYFHGISYPEYAGAQTLHAFNQRLRGKYVFCQNNVFVFSRHELASIPLLAKADWLFLVYTPWLEGPWKLFAGKGFRELYQDKLERYALDGALTLVEKKVFPQAVLEIYRVAPAARTVAAGNAATFVVDTGGDSR